MLTAARTRGKADAAAFYDRGNACRLFRYGAVPSAPDHVSSQMTHHILISALGSDQTGLVHELSGKVLDSGCNIEESRMATMGSEFVVLMLVSGNWHTLTKLEKELAKDGGSGHISVRRTEPATRSMDLLPYAVDLVALDQPGIVHQLAGFFAARSIAISEMSTRSYAAVHTGAPMFNLQMVISVPSSMHISSLREEFMEFCDQFNLDAIIEPVKN